MCLTCWLCGCFKTGKPKCRKSNPTLATHPTHQICQDILWSTEQKHSHWQSVVTKIEESTLLARQTAFSPYTIKPDQKYPVDVLLQLRNLHSVELIWNEFQRPRFTLTTIQASSDCPTKRGPRTDHLHAQTPLPIRHGRVIGQSDKKFSASQPRLPRAPAPLNLTTQSYRPYQLTTAAQHQRSLSTLAITGRSAIILRDPARARV
jgi:hypothetical protein